MSFHSANNMGSVTPGTRSRLASIAEVSLARDIEVYNNRSSRENSGYQPVDAELSATFPASSHSFYHSCRRPSIASAGSRATWIPQPNVKVDNLSEEERKCILDDERTLLEDNHLMAGGYQGRRASAFDALFSRSQDSRRNSHTIPILSDNFAPLDASETTPLLAAPHDHSKEIAQAWEQACASGSIHTTWQRETTVLLHYASPLLLAFILQYSLIVAPVFTVGHIGTVELGSVSLATMTANITGFAIFQGLATSLDTLCAQAYGSGRPKLVGLQMQRMIIFLWILAVPISVLWILSDKILIALGLDPVVANLVCQYLKILIFGVPGYAVFEAGKRYVQAQGMFSASLFVLAICAPLNAFLNWFLVWRTSLRFLGAPIAAAISLTLLPIGLFIYVRFISQNGMSCWDGFTKKAWYNWGPMIKLAIPGLIMIEAEMLASEVLTFAASYFGTTELAAQSALATVGNLMFQLPFPLSIAGSTRIANLIGATLTDAAKISARVTYTASTIVGILNVIILLAFRNFIPHLFTNEQDVINIVAKTFPIVAAFQMFDATSACCNGILRGLGRQEVGGYVQLFCYYVVAMPVSFSTAFGLDWRLKGLWTGIALALGLVTIIESLYIQKIDWERSVEEAKARNAEN